MRRSLSLGIICFWLAMLGVLAHRTWWPAVAPFAPVDHAEPIAGDDWMGVYHQEQKIGYTHHSLVADADGFVFSEESLLRLTLMETPQTVRTGMRGHIGPDFTLRDMEFELSSGAGNLHVQAAVDGAQLRLTLRAGADVSQQVLPLKEPIYLPSTLRASMRADALRPGREFAVMAFDPTTMKSDRIQVRVENEEQVPHAPPGVRAWRVREEFRGMKTTAWIDTSGAVVREEGPMGLVLVRQTAEQATHEGWATATALDLVASAAVPVARPIDDPRNRRSLRLRLSGIVPDKVPSDDQQVRRGVVLTIVRPDTRTLASYRLPYGEAEHADDLGPTAFLQSDHPRLQQLARDILGDEHDAQRAALRLNDWVYEHLRKVPTVSIPNALQVLDMGEGDCNEHAVLLAALGRAAGIPTRLVAGAVYVDGAFLYHAWCEVWLGQWVSIDPALHQFPADATHIKFVVGGPDQQLGMIEIIGRLGIEVLDDEPIDASS